MEQGFQISEKIYVKTCQCPHPFLRVISITSRDTEMLNRWARSYRVSSYVHSHN